MELGFYILSLLFFVALIAGLIDSIAGGGGLITIPALMLVGLPPAAALATNKFQASAGSFTASFYFVRKKIVDLRKMKLAIITTFVGSVFGSWVVLQVDTKDLMLLLPVLLVIMGLYFLFSPHIDDKDRKKRLTIVAFSLLICPLLGFYDGFFGPGAGSFFALSFNILLGYGLPKATAHTKILNFVSNVSSLLYFIIYGNIHWGIGIVMIGGQLIGANIGARLVISKGTTIIKPIVVSVCFLMSINILYMNLG